MGSVPGPARRQAAWSLLPHLCSPMKPTMGRDPEIRCLDFFEMRALELSTPSPGPVFRPGSFSVGPWPETALPGGEI